jgi:hypothetical protein
MTAALTAAPALPRPGKPIPSRFLRERARADTPDKFTGQLYQLPAAVALRVGAYVVIDGPHDTFGVVQGVERKDDPQHGPRFVHLVRGTRRQPGFTPQLHWPN